MKFTNLEENLKSIRRQYSVFIVVGVISFLFGILFLKLFYKEFGMNLLLANTISFIVVSGINFFLSIRYVFLRGRFSLHKEILIFYAAAGVSLVIDNLFLYILVEQMDIYYILGKIISVFIVSLISFFLKKYFVFKK